MFQIGKLWGRAKDALAPDSVKKGKLMKKRYKDMINTFEKVREKEKGNLFESSNSAEFWCWANTEGLEKYPELREVLAPFPDSNLMSIVSGTESEKEFATGGTQIYQSLSGTLSRIGHKWEDFGNILDFACGSARVTRLLLKYADKQNIYGSDLNKSHIEWCKNSLPFGTFVNNGEIPPTQFASGFFNLIYCISLFSHLNEENHHMWLRELKRITDPHGVLILTVHGKVAMKWASEREDIFKMISVDRGLFEECRVKIDRGGFGFIRQKDSYLNPEVYGITFISPDYIRKVWSQYFDVLAIEEGAIQDWQDSVVLRPRG